MNAMTSTNGSTSIALPERRVFPQGTTIFKEGQQADAAYIIETGRVEFFKMIGGRRIPLGAAGPRELFGASSLLDDQPRSAAAIAVEEVSCLVVSRQAMDTMLAGAHDGLIVVIDRLVEGLRLVCEKLAEARFQLMELAATRE
jgi:CRP-like cAMP-binding protein